MAYKKCPYCTMTLDLNDPRFDDHEEFCYKRPSPGTSPTEPLGGTPSA